MPGCGPHFINRTYVPSCNNLILIVLVYEPQTMHLVFISDYTVNLRKHKTSASAQTLYVFSVCLFCIVG